MLPDDSFTISIPSEFDEQSQKLWEQATKFAAKGGANSNVFPWHFFAAWLSSVEDEGKPSAHDFLKAVGGSSGLSHQDLKSLRPVGALTEAFSLALIDSYRFANTLSNVNHRWIIPNLLHNHLPVAQSINLMGIDLRQFLKSILDEWGEPYSELFGHYVFRLWGYGSVYRQGK